MNGTSVWVTNLRPGSKLLLQMVGLANKTMEGAVTMVEGYTKPEPVSDLNLTSSKSSVTANWHLPGSNYEYFIVELQSEGSNKTNKTSNETSLTFDSLSPAVNYTVTVYTVCWTFQSDPQVMSTFTLPVEPRSASIRPCNTSMACKGKLTLDWIPPEGVVTATYLVRYKAKFWNNTWQESTVSNNLNSVEITDLHAETTYDFEVQTKAGNLISDPATASGSTAPEKRNLTLSVLCSSSELLFCNNESTITYVLNELKNHFKSHLDGVFWELQWKEP